MTVTSNVKLPSMTPCNWMTLMRCPQRALPKNRVDRCGTSRNEPILNICHSGDLSVTGENTKQKRENAKRTLSDNREDDTICDRGVPPTKDDCSRKTLTHAPSSSTTNLSRKPRNWMMLEDQHHTPKRERHSPEERGGTPDGMIRPVNRTQTQPTAAASRREHARRRLFGP